MNCAAADLSEQNGMKVSWSKRLQGTRPGLLLAILLIMSGCVSGPDGPDMGGIYNVLAQAEDPYRNPVILIPGTMGSRLIDQDKDEVIWGVFGPSSSPNSPGYARQIALPMSPGKSLAELHDNVTPDGALDRVKFSVIGLDIERKAYFYLLSTLGIAGYRDERLGVVNAIDYGDLHYTCFQYDYDWRRDLVESAQRLHEFILARRTYVQRETEKKYGIVDLDVHFDIVALSMGGLVARYYLRYGAAELPADGSLPELTWEGAKYVDNLILVATPNAGSTNALINLANGFKFGPFLARYDSALIGTHPSAYQLLPRSRHEVLVDEQTNQPLATDIYDPDLWVSMNWGLANPDHDDVLSNLLPGITDAGERRNIALDHLQKSLSRARQFTAALDVPASPPKGVSLFLMAGDAKPTDAVASVNQQTGKIKVQEKRAGDGRVLRSSALMDERTAENRQSRLISPIAWTSVQFLYEDHLGLTKDPVFADNLLYYLWERPTEARD